MTRKKRVLAIGAGPEQVGFIRKAQSIGCFVLALDGDPRATGLGIADEGRVVDIRDEAAVIDIARETRIDLTLPQPIGPVLTTQGAVHDALGLRGVTREAARRCTDKELFHRCLDDSGVMVPTQYPYDGGASLWADTGSAWPFPVVLKPRHGAGSRGVRILEDADDWLRLKQSSPATMNHYLGGAVVEAFVQGTMLGLDGAVVDGEVILTLIREKEMTPPPDRVELVYRAPANLPEDAEPMIRASLQQSLETVGVEGSVFHADAVWTADGNFVMIELSARPAGLMITQKLVPESTGVDFLMEAIRLHDTGRASFSSKQSRPTLLYYWHHVAGRVVRAPTVGQLLEIPFVATAEVNLKPGDLMRAPSSVAELVPNGYMLLVADEWVDIQRAQKSALSLFEIQ